MWMVVKKGGGKVFGPSDYFSCLGQKRKYEYVLQENLRIVRISKKGN